MPAERSRGSRRTEADGNRLVWTLPVEPKGPSEVAFAPNLTPVTFDDDMPPAVFPPFESTFTTIDFDPAADDQARRAGTVSHAKKKPDNHIPRPPNAFILFRSHFIKSNAVSTGVETNHSTLSKIIGLTWKNLPDPDRKVWHDKARDALEEHKRKFPEYAFRPSQSRGGKGGGGTGKRRVREVEPKDMKRCARIAELLVEGKTGEELDAAVQEFDKHHVPQIVTRFEAPITARAFRRPSSTPPEAEDTRPGARFLQEDGKASLKTTSTKASRKPLLRAASLDIPETKPLVQTPVASVPVADWQQLESAVGDVDFSSFSFDSFALPVEMGAIVEPMSPVDVASPNSDAFSFDCSSPMSASSEYSFDWAQCSSPVMPDSSPSTPPDYQQYGGSYDPMVAANEYGFPHPLPSFDELMTACRMDEQQPMYIPGAVMVDKAYSFYPDTMGMGPSMSHADDSLAAFMNLNVYSQQIVVA